MPEAWMDGAFFYRKFTFRFGDCDSQEQATIHALMKLFSELAGEDYERRGMGYELLRQQAQAMLISHLRLKFHRQPVHMEQTIACTWERGAKGPYFLRDFELRTDSGELLVAGTSQWFMVDIISREVLRPVALSEKNRVIDPRRADCPNCEKLSKSDALPFLGSRPVYYSDLDANGHVNNAVYGRIAVDFLPEELLRKQLEAFSINFSVETKPGESLELCGAQINERFQLRGSAGGTLRFGCAFDFKD